MNLFKRLRRGAVVPVDTVPTHRLGERFHHPAGTRPQAVILDIDGTLQNWGSSTVKAGMDFARRHHDAGHVLIVVSARDHEYDFDRSFDWLLAHLPYPFVGPILRPKDDPRFASDFKLAVAESLSGIYEIVGAADDSRYVVEMWQRYAETHPGFDICEAGYDAYADWRRDLPSTVGRSRTSWRDDDWGWDGYDRWEGHSTLADLVDQTGPIDVEEILDELGEDHARLD